MNPRTITAARWRVRAEVMRIRRAWPTARICWSSEGLTATCIILGPNSTYIIEVTPEGTRSLWVSHTQRVTPVWREGWDD